MADIQPLSAGSTLPARAQSGAGWNYFSGPLRLAYLEKGPLPAPSGCRNSSVGSRRTAHEPKLSRRKDTIWCEATALHVASRVGNHICGSSRLPPARCPKLIHVRGKHPDALKTMMRPRGWLQPSLTGVLTCGFLTPRTPIDGSNTLTLYTRAPPGDRRHGMQLAKRDEAPPPLVPKNQAHTLETLAQRKPPDVGKLRVIP